MASDREAAVTLLHLGKREVDTVFDYALRCGLDAEQVERVHRIKAELEVMRESQSGQA